MPGRGGIQLQLLKELIVKRFHVHLHVDDLQASIAFYSKLFSAQPARVETDYAKWMLEDPRVNFAISTRGNKPGLDHLGFAEMALIDEGETTCCYARSKKHWIVDPQGIPWEHFRTLCNVAVFNEQQQATEGGACCVPVRGKPIGIPVKSQSSCC
jgi:hypothetical protein